MKKILSWLITPLFLVVFYGILISFHPLLLISYQFSFRLYHWILVLMNRCILLDIRYIAGAKFQVLHDANINFNTPVLVVGNHQSMYDIPLFIWNLKELHPKFVAKKELGKGIPSISFALRTMGSVLIDRKDQALALEQIQNFGKSCAEKKVAAVIFPEGTRARDGALKNFKAAGFSSLLSAMPNATIVPVAIAGSWRLLRHNLLPIPYGEKVTFHALSPISSNGRDPKDLLKEVREKISIALHQDDVGES